MVVELNRIYSKQRDVILENWGDFFTRGPDAPQEIGSGALWPDPNIPGCYCIEANTASGHRRFRYAREEPRWHDAQSQEDCEYSPTISPLIEHLQLRAEHLASRAESLTVKWHKSKSESEKWSQSSPEIEQLEDDLAPEALLQRLESETTSHEEKRRAVIEIEVITFPPESAETLNRSLYQFIQQHRDSDIQEDIVAVGCAIRKYVAVMSQDDLSHLAVLLDARHNAAVPIEVELEITKTLVRKLTQVPPEKPDSEPRLADRLHEIVELYLNPRLLARDKFAAVALNAILSLCLLRSAYTDKVQQSLQALQVSWFSELVLRRASQIQEVLQRTSSVEQASRYGEQLISLNKESAPCDG